MKVLFICLIIFAIIFLTHKIYLRIKYSKPLTENEIQSLASLRRKNSIYNYYSFSQAQANINAEFKKNMKPNGKFYSISESLYSFPSVAAALLKYKKHEWIIIAYEKDKKVDLVWINKGYNRESVSLNIDFREIVEYASKEKYSSLMIFHNHPNTNPNLYICNQPSLTDLNSASEFWKITAEFGINLIEYICERGAPYRYFLKTTENFMAIEEIVMDIRANNDISGEMNYNLHMERLKLLKKEILENYERMKLLNKQSLNN